MLAEAGAKSPVASVSHEPHDKKERHGTYMEFTHFDDNGNAFMVDVSEKEPTHREAVACGSILVSREAYDAIIGHKVKKGDVLTVAQVAGIMGAKRTAELIPMCHILNLTNAKITFELVDFNQAEETVDEALSSSASQLPQKRDFNQKNGTASDTVAIKAYCRVKVDGKTGVEMEALTGVSVALLTIYDMCKAIDKRMVISDIHLLEKSGGKSGDFRFDELSSE